MPKSMRVQIDSTGHIHSVEPTASIPEGFAVLSWPTADEENLMSLAEPALSDWLRPEEDEAWAHFQLDK